MNHEIEALAALVREYKQPLSIETVQIDAPRATEVRVRMVGTGICHTDIVFSEGEGFALSTPCILGHEGAGVVESVGAEVTGLVPGDHVVLSFNSCGICRSCSEAHPAYCLNMGQLNYSGGRGADGISPVSQNGQRISAAFFNQSSFATYAIADQRNTVKVPKDVPLEILGPLGCGVQTGAGAVINSLAVGPGDTLAVFGGGSVGLSALLGALAVGAAMVIVVEPNEERGKLALDLGAAHVINPKVTPDVVAEIRRLSDGGVSHALDTTGIPAVLTTASEAVGVKGMMGFLGMPSPADSLPINILSMMMRGASVKGIVEGDSDPQVFIPQMIEMYQDGRFAFDRLITKFPFARINEAIEASASGIAIKPVLIF